ncbi:hypothetical protein [Legionella cincinnatiensis]|uniref:Peptidase M1 membrane alanine aminopeptidase domain-containing protein n=1 Tax=Legionella cincinnatiensis TaxID=28085 RepID=A0A378IIW2_9GAMM|nr:hypothetical protein [Legionella cincinnatiensis]KTC82084.1 hypothetical protein Lcin_3154 [Legionella cincinnatiensis]STX34870.1 Uncharacterised protein [Legionella cincinnatiensis]
MNLGFFSNSGKSPYNKILLKCPCNTAGLKNLNLVVSQLMAFSKTGFNVIIEESTGSSPAISFPDSIIVSKKLLEQPISVIAFVMAHEWGHQMFGHTTIPPYLRPTSGKQFDEDSADSYAARFYTAHEYNLGDVYQFNALFFPEEAQLRNEKIALSAYWHISASPVC